MIKIAWGKGHGFSDPTEGDGNINKDRLLIRQEGAKRGLDIAVDGESNKYGDYGLFEVRRHRHEVVARMVSWIEKQLEAGNVVVLEGYSNGCNYWIQAVRQVCLGRPDLMPGQRILMILVHAAVRTKVEIPDCVNAVWFWTTRSDWAVRAATFASIFRLVPQWGRAGYLGYRGDDERVTKPDMDLTNVAEGHGGAYHDHNLRWGAKEKVEWVLEQMEGA